MPNMKTIINAHNHKIIYPKTITKERTFNCEDKGKCQVSQNCFINNTFKKHYYVNQPTLQRENLIQNSRNYIQAAILKPPKII